MKKHLFIGVMLSLLAAFNCVAQGTSFTYQGVLNQSGAPANGSNDLTFSLYNAASGGSVVAASNIVSDLLITNGLFTVTLDFGGSAFIGNDRWLEIAVRPGASSGAYTNLTPRQPLTPAPYAIFAGGVNASSLIGQVTDNNLSTTLTFARTFSNPGNQFYGNGANLTALNASQLISGTVPAAALSNAWRISGNAGTTPGTHFLGTTDNQALEFKVNNERALRLEPNGISPNMVGGYISNSIGSGSAGAVIAGGGASGLANTVGANSGRSAIGGGEGNQITDNVARAVIAGGANNRIGPDGAWATISGGRDNAIGPNGDQSVIGGGALHSIQGNWTVIGGGLRNTNDLFSDQNVIGGGNFNYIGGGATWSVISGGQQNSIANDADFAMVPGGLLNAVTGKYGLAAGRRAKANHQGAFVWGDSTDADFASTANNQFLIRASGNVGINKDNPATALDVNGTVTATGFAGAGNGLTGVALLNGGNTFSGNQIVTGGSVGIGATPDRPLAIREDSSNGEWLSLKNISDQTKWHLNSRSGGLNFSQTGAGDYRLYLATNGNVGIGTGSPTSKLEVAGTVAASALRAPGAGINTGTYAFTHRATAGNLSGHQTFIDNPLCNGDPNAILVVTHNWSKDTSANKYHPQVLGVYNTALNWAIFHEDNATPMEVGDAFNVIVIKP